MENAETESQSLCRVSFSCFLSLLGTVLTYFTLIRKVWIITYTRCSFPQCRPLNLLQIHSLTSIISAPGLLTQGPLDMKIERWEMRASSITRQGCSDTNPWEECITVLSVKILLRYKNNAELWTKAVRGNACLVSGWSAQQLGSVLGKGMSIRNALTLLL